MISLSALLPLILAMFVHGQPWGIGELAVALLVAAGIIAVLFIAVKAMGLQVPQWVWQIVCVMFVVVIGVLAIKFLMSL